MDPLDSLAEQFGIFGDFGPDTTEEDFRTLTVGEYRDILDAVEATIASLPSPPPDVDLAEITAGIAEVRSFLAPYADSQIIGEITDFPDDIGGGDDGGPTDLGPVYASAAAALAAQSWTVEGATFLSPEFTADVIPASWQALGGNNQVLYSGASAVDLSTALSAGWGAAFLTYVSGQPVLEQALLATDPTDQELQDLPSGLNVFPSLAWTILPAAIDDLLNNRAPGSVSSLQSIEQQLSIYYGQLIGEITNLIPTLEGTVDTFFLGYREGELRMYESGFGDVAGTDLSDVFYLSREDDTVDGSSLGDLFFGGAGNDNLSGGAGIDHLFGGTGNDTMTGGAGDDDIHGGEESMDINADLSTDNDVAIYAGDLGNFTISLTRFGEVYVNDRSGAEGNDRLASIETLTFGTGSGFFEDGVIDLTKFGEIASLSGPQITEFVELYIAYFDRAPDAIGLNFWGSAFATGTSLAEISELFLTQTETSALYPEGLGNRDFATEVYRNVLGREPDLEGLDFWVPLLDSGAVTRGTFILEAIKGAKADPGVDDTAEEIALRQGDQAYLADKTFIGGQFAVVNGLSDVADATAVMELFVRGDQDSVQTALDQIAQDRADAEANGEFLMPLIGFDQFNFGTDPLG